MDDEKTPSPADIARARERIPAAWLDTIEALILRAQAPADFVPELAVQWGRSRRRVWEYVRRVRLRLAERAKTVDPDADREMIRAMLLNAYRRAESGGMKGPDAKGMVAAARTLAEVTGVAAPRKVDITSGGKAITVYAPEEREP